MALARRLFITGALATQALLHAAAVSAFPQPLSSSVAVSADPFDHPPTLQDTSDDWACDVAAWVRAPDLVPGHTQSGDVRLKANGTACGEVTSVELGLRFKERAILRIKRDDELVPKRPVQPAWNASMSSTNSDDLYNVNGGMIWPSQDNYHEEMRAYADAMKNASFWKVKGVEREVFDIKLALRDVDRIFPDAGEAPSLNNVWPFKIATPLTSFPPSSADGSMHLYSESDGMSEVETMLEYFVRLHLSTGRTVEKVAGQTAFVPVSVGSGDATLMDSSLDLRGPNLTHPEYRFNPRPACEEGRFTNFTLSLDPSEPVSFIQGHNISLPVTITRTGNGSEIATLLSAKLFTRRNLTWARSVTSADEYRTIEDDVSDDHSSWMRSTRMLKVQPVEEVRREAAAFALAQKHRRNVMTSYTSYGFGEGSEVEPVPSEVKQQKVSINVTVPHDAMPDANLTLSSFTSSLQFRLTTAFLCDEPDELPGADTESGTAVIDELDWTDRYTAPTPVKTARAGHRSRASTHTGSLPITVLSSARSTSSQELIHYTSPSALSPALIYADADPSLVIFTPVGAVLRDEAGSDELRRRRFDIYTRIQRNWEDRRPQGGAFQHAAKVWQAKEEREKDAVALAASAAGKGATESPALVLQN